MSAPGLAVKTFIALLDDGLAAAGVKLLYPERAPAGYWITKQRKLAEYGVTEEDAGKLGRWLATQSWFTSEPSVARLFHGFKLLDYLARARKMPDERPIRRL